MSPFPALIDSLPEELLLQVFNYLDSLPPSQRHARNEPTLRLTSSFLSPLKQISLVSHRWRRVVLPLLFRNSRFRIDTPEPRPNHWNLCPLCAEEAFARRIETGRYIINASQSVDRCHFDMLDAAAEHLSASGPASPSAESIMSTPQTVVDAETRHIILTWLPRFYHGLCDYLYFLRTHDLNTKVESFVLLTARMLPEKIDRFPHRAAQWRDWRYRAIVAFWHQLLAATNPMRVAILAPPMDLACLTSCAIDTFGDWAFGDMDFHLLVLEHEGSSPPCPASSPPIDYATLAAQSTPTAFPGVATAGILNLRTWTSVSLNEGSFLKAYGTYEYFERGPPSVIYSINAHLSGPLPTERRDVPDSTAVASPLPHGLHALRSFTYTAIFPFASHLDFRVLLHRVETLDIQLAPAPSSTILDSKARVGKAELQDCWAELLGAYQNLVKRLASFRISRASVPRLSRLVCRDVRIAALRDELDETFVPLCLPVWAEFESGLFRRLAGSADEGGFYTGQQAWT